VETPEAELEQAGEAQSVETAETEEESTTEDSSSTEGETVDTAETEEGEASTEEQPDELSREEFTRIADEFGSDIAVQTVKDGGDYSTALKAAHDGLKTENEGLRKEIAELRNGKNGKPAAVKQKAERVGTFHLSK
jgi:hypothetical protein